MSKERIEKWCQKLLDFSARNRLLNIPASSRQVVALECADVCALEDAIASDKVIDIVAKEEAPKDALLVSPLSPKETKRRMNDLYHDAKASFEEAGVNTLFIAVGVLDWREDAPNAKTYAAPILLVPVRLERKNMKSGVKMRRLDDETIVNITLVEFLKSQFGIAVEGVTPLPTDDHGVDVAKVLACFRSAIAGREGWEVEEKLFIGCFSFGKFVMWKDMTSRMEELEKNKLVEHIERGDGVFDDGIAVFPPEELSSHVKPESMFCPLAADSSQLAAVVYSQMGKTFVLHGPPGTGKSQTIANMIAQNLALGRRVLFVSEKKAALDVVKSRLDKIGLAPFCLELHSNKTEKPRFYAQIREAIEAAEASNNYEWESVIEGKTKCQAELDGYVQALHKVYPCGMSAFDCLDRLGYDGKALSGEEHESFTRKFDATSVTHEEYAQMREAVSRLAEDAAQVDMAGVAAFPRLKEVVWSPVFERDLGEAVRTAACEVEKFSDGYAAAKDLYCKDRERKRKIRNILKAILFFKKTWAEPRELTWREIALKFSPGFASSPLAEALSRYDEFAVDESASPEDFVARAGELSKHIGEARNVMRYMKSRDEAAACGVDCIKSVDAFETLFAKHLFGEVVSHESALRDFNAVRHEECVAKFRELEKRATKLASEVVVARLSAALPRKCAPASPEAKELAVLKRECTKKTRLKPVRQILAETPNLLPRLKPCFLMSPLSVAQYLDVSGKPFDILIFDEASQIPVWDAIGVIARANQLIVVGDPKQMPPTNFFNRTESEEEDEEESQDVADQESILDECLVAGVYSAYLDWHYRSRHESLISFSNEHYYEGRLCTFPAASSSPTLGVAFKFVEDGRFVREGRSMRANPVEAKALVDYVCDTVKTPGRKPRSIGIVTFAIPQQKLIRSMLDERRAADPELDAILGEEGEGAYFVKNLENVQGDEADVILFSIGFAPDEEGRFSMNFGPLNRVGGERRLNVAVTRAKEQIVVFSSIHSTQIDAGEDGRTKSVGASHLKAFLEYAERGGAARDCDAARSSREAFADAVAKFVEGLGYEAVRGVGTSTLRIDIGVRKRGENDFIAGIECDGRNYAAQKSAKDRDFNRPGVLAGLGWRLIHVWSADWALDRNRAEERLRAALVSIS